MLVGLAVTAITLLVALPAAYALARLRLAGAASGIAIFLVYLIPPTLLFIPMARVITNLGLQESLWSLILVYPTITIPISAWLLMGFFKGSRWTSRNRQWSTATAGWGPSPEWCCP